MRVAVLAVVTLFVTAPFTLGLELTEEQKGPWNTLEEQVALDMKKDLQGEMKYLHPKGCLWGDQLPVPITPSPKTYSYYTK